MKRLLPLVAILLLAYCSSDENPEPDFGLKKGCTVPISGNFDPEAQIDDGSCQPIDCSQCTYTIPAGKVIIDGIELGIGAGDVICLDAAIDYLNLNFKNIVGTSDKPVTIVNCGGVVTMNATGKGYGIKTENSRHFKITGVGSGGSPYGIKLHGAQQGMQLLALSTNFEISGLEIYDAGFAGIMAKTDPTCDNETIRGNFVMQNVAIHHNYIHDTGGEGLYIGNSFYADGVNVGGCGTRMPHEIHGLRIFQNIVKNTGWDAIQIGCATDDIEVHNNTAENFGTENKSAQWSGIQIGEGSGGLYYNNLIKKGTGQGFNILGLGNASIYNNVIFDVGKHGIFSDLRGDGPFGSGYKIINNTVVSPGIDGIVVYAKDVTKNIVINNLVVNPGSYGNYGSNTAKAFLNVGAAAPTEASNNYFAETAGDAKFQAAGSGDFRILTDSPAKDAGKDVAAYQVTTDFLGTARPKGAAYDIGAFEF